MVDNAPNTKSRACFRTLSESQVMVINFLHYAYFCNREIIAVEGNLKTGNTHNWAEYWGEI